MGTGHHYLKERNVGNAQKLVGKVNSLVFFVNDSVSSWNARAKKEYFQAHNEALKELEKQAKAQRVQLSFRVAQGEVSISGDCGIRNSEVWRPALAKSIGAKSVADYERWFLHKHPAAEAPVIFVFNKMERSFAQNANLSYPTWDEFSVVFRDNNGRFSARTVMHELLHQFGGVDYYYPDYVQQEAKRFFPGSIMNVGYPHDNRVDSLTAYLIGWREDLDSNANAFLAVTKFVTPDAVDRARRKSIEEG